MNPTEFQRIPKNLKESKESHRILCNSVLFQICFCLHTSKAPKVFFCFSKLCNVTWGDHIDVSLSVARRHRGLLVLYFVIVNPPVLVATCAKYFAAVQCCQKAGQGESRWGDPCLLQTSLSSPAKRTLQTSLHPSTTQALSRFFLNILM